MKGLGCRNDVLLRNDGSIMERWKTMIVSLVKVQREDAP